jgi:hypothetical protein
LNFCRSLIDIAELKALTKQLRNNSTLIDEFEESRCKDRKLPAQIFFFDDKLE